jgi:hypothetical protein
MKAKTLLQPLAFSIQPFLNWWATTDLHLVAVRKHFRPVKSRSFTIIVCSLNANAKAESNRRSQACEVLAVTGIRVA